MPGDFRIAGGYVEVTTKLDKDKLRAAGKEAGAALGAEMGPAGDKAGKTFSDRLAGSVGAATAAAGGDRLTDPLVEPFGRGGDRAGEDFTERSTARLRDAKGRFVKAGTDLGDALGSGLGGGGSGGSSGGGLFSKIGGILSQLDTKLESAMTGLGAKAGSKLQSSIGGALSSLVPSPQFVLKWGSIIGAGLEYIPPILTAIEGGLAAIPALAIGAAGAIGVLGLGLHGIGAALGEVFSPPAGGGAGSSIDQVAAAERRLTQAQQSAVDAQKNLNDARVQATFDLVDMNLELTRSQHDEAQAALAVKQARLDLANARNTAQDPYAVQRAQLALQAANDSLAEAKQHTIELQEQTAKANAAGVEGSDKVHSALEAQQSAVNGVIDAQNALKQASISAGAASATAISKLAPNARAFVDEVARLKPQLVDLQQYVQDRLFAGLDKKLDTWAHVWIPGARRDLGMLADDANQFTKRLGDDLSKPEMRQAVDGVFASIDRVLDRFTNGGALDKLVTGFADLVREATPFVETIATGLVDELGRLGDWLDKESKNGGMKKFFSDAAHDAHDLWDIGKDVFAIISDIINVALGKQDAKKNGNPLDNFKDTLDKIKAWADSDSGKKTISDILQGFHDAGTAVVNFIGFLKRCYDKFVTFHEAAVEWRRGVTNEVDAVERGFKLAFLNIESTVVNAFGTILNAADTAFGWLHGPLGNQLDTAKRQFSGFADSVNNDLKRIRDFSAEITIHDSGARRFGGVDHWAKDGLVSLGRGSAGIYPATPGGLVGFAEQGTRGELFMPHDSNNMARQQALAGVAAQWAGGRFAPTDQAPATAASVQPATSTVTHVHVHVGDMELASFVLNTVSGNPTVVAKANQEGARRRTFTTGRVN